MAKNSALAFGIIFLIVGVWGFFQNPVLGMFEVDTLHNIVHIVLGLILAGVAMKSADKSAAALKWIGIVYLLLAVIGFVQKTSILGIVTVNGADNWLHLVLGIILLALGLAGKKSSMSTPVAPQM